MAFDPGHTSSAQRLSKAFCAGAVTGAVFWKNWMMATLDGQSRCEMQLIKKERGDYLAPKNHFRPIVIRELNE